MMLMMRQSTPDVLCTSGVLCRPLPATTYPLLCSAQQGVRCCTLALALLKTKGPSGPWSLIVQCYMRPCTPLLCSLDHHSSTPLVARGATSGVEEWWVSCHAHQSSCMFYSLLHPYLLHVVQEVGVEERGVEDRWCVIQTCLTTRLYLHTTCLPVPYCCAPWTTTPLYSQCRRHWLVEW